MVLLPFSVVPTSRQKCHSIFFKAPPRSLFKSYTQKGKSLLV